MKEIIAREPDCKTASAINVVGSVTKLNKANVGFRYCSQKSVIGRSVAWDFKSFPFTLFSSDYWEYGNTMIFITNLKWEVIIDHHFIYIQTELHDV